MKEEMEAFVVYTNTDLTEGRGHEYPLYVCETEATALRLARKAYVQGCDAPVRKERILSIDGTLYGPIRLVRSTKEDDAAQKEMDARNAAIKKARDLGMTEEEIRAIR